MKDGKVILIFGAGGFIGTYLIDELEKRGYNTIVCDNDLNSLNYFFEKGMQYFQLDIIKKDDFEKLPERKYDAVINLACLQPANVSAGKYDSAEYIKVNTIGTINILEFCKKNKVEKYIPVFSLKRVEYKGDYSMYTISESAARDCIKHYEQFGIKNIICRVPIVYGYGPHWNIFRNGKPVKTACQIFIENAKECRPLEVWGDGKEKRNIIYVKDVVSALIQAVEIDNFGEYFVCQNTNVSLREQAEITAEIFWGNSGKPEIIDRPDIISENKSEWYDNTTAKKYLRWEPEFSFKEMMSDIKKEMEDGRFNFLVKKREAILKEEEIEKPMDIEGIEDTELMGNNLKRRLEFCGEGAKIYPMAKIALPILVSIGGKTRICDYVFIYAGQGVEIGDNCDIQPGVKIWGGGVCSIGDRVSVGVGAILLTGKYFHEGGLKMVDGFPGESRAEYGTLSIKDDAYIGAGATIMPNITIGEGSIIGAGSFVNKNTEPWGIYVGSPAKKIGMRDKIK